MYDLLLNAAKLAVSEDARKSASALIDLIRRSPEWQRDMCALDAKIEVSHREHAALLADLAATKLSALSFKADAVEAFRTSFSELVANAFEHGCGDKEAVRISMEISQTYISLTVENPKGNQFDLAACIQRCRSRLKWEPAFRRGRG